VWDDVGYIDTLSMRRNLVASSCSITGQAGKYGGFALVLNGQ